MFLRARAFSWLLAEPKPTEGTGVSAKMRLRHALTSTRMASKNQEPKQKTKPARGKPAEIPIPTRDQVLRDLTKTAQLEKKPKK